MVYKYELACREAGLTEEHTAKIRRLFDAEKKRMARDKKAREREGIVVNSIHSFVDDESDDEIALPDERVNIEEEVMHRMELDLLRQTLEEFPEEDRTFLLFIFSGRQSEGRQKAYAAKTGISEMAVSRRKARLVKTLRKKLEGGF